MSVICGIFGIISTKNSFDINKLNILAKNACKEVKMLGLIISNESSLEVIKSNLQITDLLKKQKYLILILFLGTVGLLQMELMITNL